MSTAIALRGARNVVLSNVTIDGFRKGIDATDASLLLSNVDVYRCGIGLDLVDSSALIHGGRFLENAIDIIVNRSTAFIIDTIARRILEVLPSGDYRLNPYAAQHIAYEIINTRDVQRKRLLLRKLLDILKVAGYGWMVYQISKIFFNLP